VRAPLAARALGAAGGILADAVLGEPPDRLHPVGRFGSAMVGLERRMWADDRARGAAYAGTGVLAAGVVGLLVRSTAVATGVAVAGRMLGEEAGKVAVPLMAGDLDAARAQLPALVGRRAAGLDATEVARATIESVAENTVDAVVAPVLWAVVAGAPGTLAYRAVNTLDAMVGHHTERYERFGWASARLDDLMNWVPARITAALIGLVRPASAREVLRIVRRDAPPHPSPNSGVAEAAFAAALGIRLGGVNRYGDRVENRGTLGDGRPAEAADIAESVRLLRDVRVAAVVVLVLPTFVRLVVSLSASRRGRRWMG
jgi:adenosylcobinamide-phosphate synthase